MDVGRRGLERRGRPLAGPAGAGTPPRPGGGDKRFAAPEWHANPVYRTLKEVYLLASDWLLQQGERTDMDEAERQRLTSTCASSSMR